MTGQPGGGAYMNWGRGLHDLGRGHMIWGGGGHMIWGGGSHDLGGGGGGVT